MRDVIGCELAGEDDRRVVLRYFDGAVENSREYLAVSAKEAMDIVAKVTYLIVSRMKTKSPV